MNAHTSIVTRKIQLHINSSDKAAAWATLYNWQRICCRAANYIFSHAFVQEQLKDWFYLAEGIQHKLADNNKEANGMFQTSKMNTIYQLLSRHFKGQVPMHILSSLNHTLTQHFNNEKQEYIKGEKPLRNYRNSIPIPFKAIDIRQWKCIEPHKEYSFSLYQIPFITYLGSDKRDKRILLDQWQAGEVQLCTGALQLDKGKIFWLATFKVPKQPHALNETTIAKASLSMDYPIILVIGKQRFVIGTKEEFLYRRLAIQAARQRTQQAVTYCRPQHGRDRKLKALEQFTEKERNYIQQKLHCYSSKLINLCIQYKAASLILVDQIDKEETIAANDFILRNWGYYSLKEKIAYKADKAGIRLIIE